MAFFAARVYLAGLLLLLLLLLLLGAYLTKV